jgi:hypothetical protein
MLLKTKEPGGSNPVPMLQVIENKLLAMISDDLHLSA